jgi:hypothetical protein
LNIKSDFIFIGWYSIMMDLLFLRNIPIFPFLWPIVKCKFWNFYTILDIFIGYLQSMLPQKSAPKLLDRYLNSTKQNQTFYKISTIHQRNFQSLHRKFVVVSISHSLHTPTEIQLLHCRDFITLSDGLLRR